MKKLIFLLFILSSYIFPSEKQDVTKLDNTIFSMSASSSFSMKMESQSSLFESLDLINAYFDQVKDLEKSASPEIIKQLIFKFRSYLLPFIDIPYNISQTPSFSKLPTNTAISTLTISKDGNIALLGSYYQEGKSALQIWDVSDQFNPKLLSALDCDSCIMSVALSENNSIVLLGLRNKAILGDISDQINPKILSILKGHLSDVGSVAINQNNSIAFTEDNSGIIIIWDISNKLDPKVLSRIDNLHNNLTTMISQDGSMVLAGRYGFLWDVSNRQLPSLLSSLSAELYQDNPTFVETINRLTLSNDSLIALSSMDNAKVILWDMSNPRPKALSSLKGNYPMALNFDSSLALIKSEDLASAVLFDISNRTSPIQLAVLKGQENKEITSMAINKDASRALISDYTTVNLWFTNINLSLSINNLNLCQIQLLAKLGSLRKYDGELEIPDHCKVFDSLNAEIKDKIIKWIKKIDPNYSPRVDKNLRLLIEYRLNSINKMNGNHIAEGLYKALKNNKQKQDLKDLKEKQNNALVESQKKIENLEKKNLENQEKLEKYILNSDQKRQLEELEIGPGFTIAQNLEKQLSFDDKVILKKAIREKYVNFLKRISGDNSGRLKGHLAPINSVSLNNCGKLAVTGSTDNIARVWDIQDPYNPSITTVLKGHGAAITGVVFSADNESIYTAALDKKILCWDIQNPTNPSTIWASSPINSLALNYTGNLILIGLADNNAALWNIARTPPKLKAMLAGHSGSIDGVVFSYDGNLIVTGSSDHTARIWGLDNTSTSLQTLTGHNAAVKAVAISNDNKLVLSGSVDNSAILWNIANIKTALNLARLKGHTDSVNTVAFAPDGKQAFTGSSDSTVKIWDISDLKNIVNTRTITDHNNAVLAIAVNNRYLLTGCADSFARLFNLNYLDLDNLDLVQLALFIKLANLTGLNKTAGLNQEDIKNYKDIINTLDIGVRGRVLELYPEFRD